MYKLSWHTIGLDATEVNITSHGKYRGWNGSTIAISCWVNLARPSAGIKKQPKNMGRYVVFIVFFKLYLEISGGDGVNQFIVKIHSHIAIVVMPPSIKSFANQKKLVKSQSGHTEMITSDLQRVFPYDHCVIWRVFHFC